MPIVFTNVRVFDGSGVAPFEGEVRVEGERISQVARGEGVSREGATLVDGGGATLMPGLTEAHCHLTWPSSVEKFVPGMSLPPDDLALTAARNARILLDHGYTSAYSGGALGRRVDVALHAQIESGGLPGPRLIPSTIEREPASENDDLGMGSVGEHGRGPDAIRAFIKESAEIGVKAIKVLLSGENALKPGASFELQYTEEEAAAAGDQARESNVWLTAHCHAAEAVKMGVRNGFRALYHCTFADEEAIDLLEEHKDELFVAPSIGIAQATLDAAAPPQFDMSYMKEDAAIVLERQHTLSPELKRRGVRLLPGGDYGFPFNPTGCNARDLELFVTHLGFSPAETLVAATRHGGALMGRPDELGQIRPGYLADILLVMGDPTVNIAVLQNTNNLHAIMKGGRFHKPPPTRIQQ